MSSPIDTPVTFRNPQLRELAMLYDVPLQISIEIGRLKFRVGELVKLSTGSLIELKRPAGEPLDICINGNHAHARGEIRGRRARHPESALSRFLKPGSVATGTIEP